MDDVERAVDDAINTYKALTRDPRFVPGAGATEIELARQLASYGEVRGGLLLGLISIVGCFLGGGGL
jgi:T-complex protein 1 subunit theta